MLYGIPITGETVAFFLLALIIVTSGVLLLNLEKVMHMALSLIGVFLGVAGIYILLGADFLGVVQILIYAGAITILMVFALMLTERGDNTATPRPNRVRAWIAFVPVAAFVGLMLYLIRNTAWPVGNTPVEPFGAPTVNLIANDLFHAYTVPFELVSLVLTAALVGAVVIARKEE